MSDVGVTSFRGLLEQYEIMGNLWALAGCYDVDTKVEGATVRKKFVHWMERMCTSETCASGAST